MQVSLNVTPVMLADDVLNLTQDYPTYVLSGQLMIQKKQITARKMNVIYSPLNERLEGGEQVVETNRSWLKTNKELINYSSGNATSIHSFLSKNNTTNQNELSGQSLLTSASTFTVEIKSGSGRGDSGRGDNGVSTGQLLPIGDMILPMIAMAFMYTFYKVFHLNK